MLDTHFHLDFLPASSRRTLIDELSARDVEIVAQTVRPTDFEAVPGVRSAVGYHPWYVDDGGLDAFEAALQQTRFVGEVGLDFAPRHKDSADLQVDVFRRVMALTCDAASSIGALYVASIHAVRSVTAVLDVLEDLRVVERGVVPIIHWFSGTSDELTRHIRTGGHISISPRMLETKRGRAYVSQVPADRLLLETDLPSGPGDHDPRSLADEVSTSLSGVIEKLTELRDENIAAVIAENEARLFA